MDGEESPAKKVVVVDLEPEGVAATARRSMMKKAMVESLRAEKRSRVKSQPKDEANDEKGILLDDFG